MLTDDEILERIKGGQRYVQKFAQNDRGASRRFVDPKSSVVTGDPGDLVSAMASMWDGGDVPTEVSVGQTNPLAATTLVKIASIAINSPDVQVTCGNPENAPIVRKFLRDKWRHESLVRLTWLPLMKRCVGGIGILAARWDKKKRVRFAHIQSWDFALDPNATRIEESDWLAYRFRLPRLQAEALYGVDAFESLDSENKKDAIEDVWLYYDLEVEAVCCGKRVKMRPNLYEKPPLLFYLGDQNPGATILPLSDFMLAGGLAANLNDLDESINNSAKHGGNLRVVSLKELDEGGEEALKRGRQQGYVPVKDVSHPPIANIPGEALSSTVLEAKRASREGLNEITGINGYDTGGGSPGVNFATEAAILDRRSGSRGVQARIEFERFVLAMMLLIVEMEQKFGGPQEGQSPEVMEQEYAQWQAFLDVQEVQVIEGSTEYKDASVEQQQSMQLLQLIAGLFPLFVQIGGRIPNLESYADDVLRAFGRHDVARYWLEAPAQPQGALPGGDGGNSGNMGNPALAGVGG